MGIHLLGVEDLGLKVLSCDVLFDTKSYAKVVFFPASRYVPIHVMSCLFSVSSIRTQKTLPKM